MLNKFWYWLVGHLPDDEDEAERNLRWTRNTIIIGLGAGFGCNILFAGSTRALLAMMGATILVSGAAFAIGALVGFLFGIPRTEPLKPAENKPKVDPPVTDDEGNEQPVRGQYQVNTNLEQVSDWLTKILVGVGLTQINQIPTEIGRISTWLAENLGEPSSMKAVIATSMIYFLVCGFLAGYVMTRLFLSDAFAYADGRHKAGTDILHMVKLFKLYLTGPDTPEKTILRQVICDLKDQKKYVLAQDCETDPVQYQALRWLKQQGLIRPEGARIWKAGTEVCLTAMAQKVLPLVMDVVPCDVAGTSHPGQGNGMNPPAAGPSTPTPSIPAP